MDRPGKLCHPLKVLTACIHIPWPKKVAGMLSIRCGVPKNSSSTIIRTLGWQKPVAPISFWSCSLGISMSNCKVPFVADGGCGVKKTGLIKLGKSKPGVMGRIRISIRVRVHIRFVFRYSSGLGFGLSFVGSSFDMEPFHHWGGLTARCWKTTDGLLSQFLWKWKLVHVVNSSSVNSFKNNLDRF